jgi:hypothetical protein
LRVRSEYSAEKAAAAAVRAGMRLSPDGIVLNPFRAPLRQPLVGGGTVGFPWVSNGFLAGFNLDAEQSGEQSSAVAAARAALAARAKARA